MIVDYLINDCVLPPVHERESSTPATRRTGDRIARCAFYLSQSRAAVARDLATPALQAVVG